MYHTLNVSAYDMLDQVVVAVQVREFTNKLGHDETIVYRAKAQVRSTGEDDPRQWAVDALVALLEEM